MVLADGMPIIWLAMLLKIPIAERVAGSTLFEALRESTTQDGIAPLKVFFFGGPDGVAQTAASRLNADFNPHAANGGMVCVGYESPGFGSIADMSTPAIIERINATNADFLVVSLGAKKGQAWIEHNRALLNTPVISHLGAVVNFVAGKVTRAPKWVQKSGLEWLWRIKEEPGLWRRYWGDGLELLKLLAKQVLPTSLHIRFDAPTLEALQSAHVSVHSLAGKVVIRVSGPWNTANHTKLLSIFEDQANAVGLLEIDFRQTDFADSAIAGALSLLISYRARNGLKVTFAAPKDKSAKKMMACFFADA